MPHGYRTHIWEHWSERIIMELLLLSRSFLIIIRQLQTVFGDQRLTYLTSY